MGQLLQVVRAEYLVDAIGFNKIQGRPFRVAEIVARVKKLVEEA
jgi:2-oxoglutarate ferredoxin oxidoreductase subunit alpha